MSSIEVTPFIHEPIFLFRRPLKRNSEFPSFKAVRRRGMELDLEEHLELAFIWDNEDEFVNAVKGLSPEKDLPQIMFNYMYANDAVNCVSALINPNNSQHFNFDLMDTAVGRIKNRHYPISTTPLHEAARYYATNLTSLLLDLGHSPNTRIHYISDIGTIQDALPLNAAMLPLCFVRDSTHPPKNKSIFSLVATICGPVMAGTLETVRLLARKTKDLDQEFFKYMKDGKLAEMCMLLLVGCRPPSASLLQCGEDIPEKEKILELFETFNTIGDKLSSYIRIKRPKPIKGDRMTCEITSLFEDSGLVVKSEDIPLMYHQGPRFYPLRPTSDSKMISVPRLLSPHAIGGSSFTNKGSSPIHGVRLFHNSSVPKVVQINQVKNKVIGDLKVPLYKHCAFLTTALRRAGRLV